MNAFDLAYEHDSALRVVREWIEATLDEYRDQAVPVADLDFPRLRKVFPPDLLSRAKAVVVPGAVPLPPLGSRGFPEFEPTESRAAAGVTYKDTFFVSRPHGTEGLYFHELIHVLQWDRLGIENFLIAYGTGLIQFGYRNCPLERMAYTLQAKFSLKVLPEDVVNWVQQETDAIWDRVTSLLANGYQQRRAVG
ncbi:MAG: hypothetical protein SVR04_15990 [Spirochaetota bacterium]|nr:hypothetical protein [Spirochaetota bacterium]